MCLKEGIAANPQQIAANPKQNKLLVRTTDDDDIPQAKNKKDFYEQVRFDKAVREAQTGEKEQMSRNINLAANIALNLTSSSGLRHVVSRLLKLSKDGTRRYTEVVVYLVDSIMRHCDHHGALELQRRFERHIQTHLHNIVKRVLRRGATRRDLSEKLLGRFVKAWRKKEWFDEACLKEIEKVIFNAVPEMAKKYSSASLGAPTSLVNFWANLYDDDRPDDFAGADTPVLGGAPARTDMLSRASAKAGAPKTPAQPVWLMGLQTPSLDVKSPFAKIEAKDVKVNGPVLSRVPQTPNNVLFAMPNTPFYKIPTTPGIGLLPSTPGIGLLPSTPGIGLLPATPCAAKAAPGVPRTLGGGVPQPFTPMMPRSMPMTPVGAAAPSTPAAAMMPFTLRPGGMTPMPGTPGIGGFAAPAPFTPAAPAQRFTPAGPMGRAAPQTPGIGAPSPFTPAGPAQPFTPAGPAQPFTPAGPAQPFTPGIGLASAAPFTPGTAQPFTPGIGLASAAPFTPGAAQPFTPGIGLAGAAPATPGIAQPFTPGLGPAAAGTPGFVPVAGGSAAPQTPGILPFRCAPGTPGYVPVAGGNAAPVTPAPNLFPRASFPAKQEDQLHPAAALTPGFMPVPGGGAMPMTPGIAPVMSFRPPPKLQNTSDIRIETPDQSMAGTPAGAQHSRSLAGSHPGTAGGKHEPTNNVGDGTPMSPTGVGLPADYGEDTPKIGGEATPTPVFHGDAQMPSHAYSETLMPNTGDATPLASRGQIGTVPTESVSKDEDADMKDATRPFPSQDASQVKRQRLDDSAPTQDSQLLASARELPTMEPNSRTPVLGSTATGDVTPMIGSAVHTVPAGGDVTPLEVREAYVPTEAALSVAAPSHPLTESGVSSSATLASTK